MNTTKKVLRPGLLVSFRTKVQGGVEYDRKEIEAEHVVEDGSKRARWETTKTVVDPAEHKIATAVVSRCWSHVSGVCSRSEFGLMCRADKEQDLNRRLDEARALAEQFNATASTCYVSVNAVTGWIEADDERAVRAIGAEVRELMSTMQQGIADADPEKIRDAAKRAKSIGQMLDPSVAGKVSAAVEEARAAANEIARRVVRGGEVAAAVVTELRTESIEGARFAFLDLDAPVEAAPMPIAAVDLDLTEPEPAPAAPAPTEYRFEL